MNSELNREEIVLNDEMQDMMAQISRKSKRKDKVQGANSTLGSLKEIKMFKDIEKEMADGAMIVGVKEG